MIQCQEPRDLTAVGAFQGRLIEGLDTRTLVQ